MPNTYFQFKEFKIVMAQSGLKVTTDACLFGAWVAEQLKKKGNDPFSLLDIGTGTGLLSLMVAQKHPSASITAVEKNLAAYEEALINFKHSPWATQLTCKHQSIQSFSQDPKFQVVLSNPPFFANHFRGKNERKNAAIHDPSLPMEDLIKSVNDHLLPDGEFFVLYPEREMQLLEKMAASFSLYMNHHLEVRNNANGKIFRVMASFSRKRKKIKQAPLFIKTKEGTYTKPFWELLSPYYLEYNNPLISK